MSNVKDVILSLAPYHLMAYGTLLGTELYQVCYLRFLARRPSLLSSLQEAEVLP